jgi:gliding motility-associated-like protein
MCGNGEGSIQLSITDNTAAPYQVNFNGGGYSSALSYSNLVSGDYSVEVMNNRGCIFDTLVHVPDNGVLSDTSLVPNCFSPNGDGANDTWVIPSFCGEKITCRILNRWGLEVAELGNGEGWDGRIKDKTSATDGIYYYIAEVEYPSGQKKTLKGFINLVR